LPLVSIKQVGVRTEPVDISDHTRVFKGDDCVVDEEASGMRGVENVMVRIFRTGTIEVRGRERASVERHGVNWGTLLPRTFNACLVFDNFKGDVAGSLCLP
jgi:hypothetical protein